jgi:hypothetical protein
MYTKKPMVKGFFYVCVVLLLLLGGSAGVALISIVGSDDRVITTTTSTNYSFWSFIRPAYAHFEHLTHYNTGGIGVGKYYVNEAVEPEYIRPREPGKILFSIQDYNGNDVQNIDTMIEIYSDNTGERLKLYPWTHQDTGDFAVYYTFPNKGNYEIVLSIANENSKHSSGGGDGSNNNNNNNIADQSPPPRTTLGSTLNCNCNRGIFNISVSENFGAVFNTAIIGGIISIISVFGAVLALSYRNRKKISDSISSRTANADGQQDSRRGLLKEDILKYSVMLLAIAAGIIHISIFSEHGSLRIEYSIFLITAGSSQVAYGILYVLLNLTGSSSNSSSKKMIVKKGDGDNNDNDGIARSRESAKVYYRKSVIINLFGLAGSAVLLLLYAYAVTFPPPLSPNNKPEDVDFAGILDKSLELFLVVGIIQLMRWEKKKLQSQLVHIQ